MRLDEHMTDETPWARLRRIADARMRRLGLTQTSLHAAGGPSVPWMTRLPHIQGDPGVRYVATMAKLDHGLRWPEGTSFGLVADDRTDWATDILEDEERGLVDMSDVNSNFAWLVETRLSAMPVDAAESMRRQIAALMGLPVRPGR